MFVLANAIEKTVLCWAAQQGGVKIAREILKSPPYLKKDEPSVSASWNTLNSEFWWFLKGIYSEGSYTSFLLPNSFGRISFILLTVGKDWVEHKFSVIFGTNAVYPQHGEYSDQWAARSGSKRVGDRGIRKSLFPGIFDWILFLYSIKQS